jgi:hypothetical protein
VKKVVDNDPRFWQSLTKFRHCFAQKPGLSPDLKRVRQWVSGTRAGGGGTHENNAKPNGKCRRQWQKQVL